MRKLIFNEWHGFHGFHGLHVHPPHLLVALISVLAPFAILLALSFLVRDIAGWLLNLLPPPLSWGP
jgi:hypothetical protein